MSSRVNFTSITKNKIGIAVGFICVRPKCRIHTLAVDPVTNTIVNIGVAAHDVAASPNGPRASSKLTDAQKRAISNGAWLCRNCAEIVDRLPMHYPAGTISGWQSKAQNDLFYGVTGLGTEPSETTDDE